MYYTTRVHSVEWMQEKPEVIVYFRYFYSADALPDWVGKFRDNVGYAEMPRKGGHKIAIHG